MDFTPNNRKIKRIWHNYKSWECVAAGMHSTTPPSGLDADGCKRKYCEFLSDLPRFGNAMERVIREWPKSCEHNLTDESLNRIAWMGQASMCIETGISREFRSGFFMLSPQQQKAANELAQKYIDRWESEYIEREDAIRNKENETENDKGVYKMEFSIQGSELQRCVNSASRVVGKNSPKEELQCLRIEAYEGGVSFHGDNLEFGSIMKCGSVVKSGGVCLVNAVKLSRCCQGLVGDIKIKVDDNAMKISGCGRKISIPIAANVAAFAKVSEPTTEAIKLSSQWLKMAFSNASQFLAENNKNQALDGVCLWLKDGIMSCLSSDRNVIYRSITAVENNRDSFYIVPAAASKSLALFLDSTETQVDLFLGSNDLIVRMPNGQFHSRLLAGTYPSLGEHVGKRLPDEVTIPSHLFSEAVSLSSLWCDIDNSGIEIDIDAGYCVVSNKSHLGGSDSRFVVACEGLKFKCEVNHKYLLPICKISKENVRMGFDSTNNSMLKFTDDGFDIVVATMGEV